MATHIDLNCDLGEGYGAWTLGDPGADDALLALVTSANVACGFHAGDPAIMAARCRTAAGRGVAVGAHVGYRDLVGFGRRPLDVPADVLAAEVAYQVGALQAVARSVGARVGYVKPHGALYNRVVRDEDQALAVVRGVAGADAGLALVGLPGSAVLRHAAEAGLRTVTEAFVDRGYRADGTLAPRGSAGSLVTDPDEAAARAVRMARDGLVTAVDGTDVAVDAQSLCVHSDTPGAVPVARAVRAALEAAGIDLRPVAP
ncbi:LamB/YcsF family protein [Cellulomonas triticagri]|uniref:5-oxoprolinase subunit A n=1 Tax=Cellulomonas triticagri TaxID=2483352 RepID=A0A3M2IXI3_9CELL|nr:5-oxoprolinase subunit PxpA [Cellulomonas triticagri]RMI06562.1 LamB/YcsF family protein [Cellulomonas triticagri]